MKKPKQIIGLLLIIVAVAALIYWEADGRSRLITEKILAAGENIEKGEIIKERMLHVVDIMPESVAAGAFRPDEIHNVAGKEASCDIAENQQISELSLREPGEAVRDTLSPFLIKADWIDSRSSSLRKGDVINIYSRDGSSFLGEFEVLFVKDTEDREITDAAGEGPSLGDSGRQGSGIRDRTRAVGIVDHIEILTELEQYQKILKFVDGTGKKLLIVQRGDTQ